MRKIIFFAIYTLAILLLGRNLNFLPAVSNSPQKQTESIKKNVIEKYIEEQGIFFSIYYKDLAMGSSFGNDENKILTGASLNKLLMIAYLYNLAKDKKIDLDRQITIQEKDIQDYGTGSIRYEGAGGTYSIRDLAKLSLEKSDNTAAFVLTEMLGRSNIENYGKNLGLIATKMEDNATSAKDMGILLELLYNKKITSAALTQEILDFMKDTDFEDRLARDLPEDVFIYHKAADGTGFVHDVGIIESGKRAFILSILTNGVKEEDKAKIAIGKIAKFIYDERSN